MNDTTDTGSRLDFGPLLTEDEIKQGESTTKAMQLGRRLALHVLKFSSAELRTMVAEDEGAEALLVALETINGYPAWRDRETDLVNAAAGRLEIVLGEIAEATE